MKLNKILIMLAALGCTAGVHAAPFIVSDPVPADVEVEPTTCIVTLDGVTRPEIPVAETADGLAYCRFDLAGLNVGAHVATAVFAATDPVWGRLVSDSSVPLEFSKPEKLRASPSGIKLSPR